jgi:hypothetical protein
VAQAQAQTRGAGGRSSEQARTRSANSVEAAAGGYQGYRVFYLRTSTVVLLAFSNSTVCSNTLLQFLLPTWVIKLLSRRHHTHKNILSTPMTPFHLQFAPSPTPLHVRHAPLPAPLAHTHIDARTLHTDCGASGPNLVIHSHVACPVGDYTHPNQRPTIPGAPSIGTSRTLRFLHEMQEEWYFAHSPPKAHTQVFAPSPDQSSHHR